MPKPDDDVTVLLRHPGVVAFEDLLLVQLYRAMEDCCNICIGHDTCRGKLWLGPEGQLLCEGRLKAEGYHDPQCGQEFILHGDCRACRWNYWEDEEEEPVRYTRTQATLPEGLEDNWDWLQRAYDAVKELRDGEPENWEEFHVSHPRLAGSFHSQFLDAARESGDEALLAVVQAKRV